MKTKIGLLLMIVAFSALILGVNSSCSDVKKYAAFDVTYKLPRVDFNYIPSKLKSGEVLLFSGRNTMNLDSLLMAHDIPTGWIQSATFTEFGISITAPPEANFGWLQSLRAIASNDSTMANSVELGHATVVDTTAKNLLLVLNNLELQPYIHRNFFYYQLLGTTRGLCPYNLVSMFIAGKLQLHVEPL
ncbi:MAG: hypothetical protein WCL00_03915 [Bacteroidota bacterium]